MWERMDAYHVLGVKPVAVSRPGVDHAPEITRRGGESGGAIAGAPLWSPNNPLFWAGGLLAVTFGLIGASTAIRVGPFRAAAAAGKS